MKLTSILSMVLLLSLFSCQKEDATPPIVEVFSPLSASSFDVLDYISVSGLATDESALEWVEIKLLNSGRKTNKKKN